MESRSFSEQVFIVLVNGMPKGVNYIFDLYFYREDAELRADELRANGHKVTIREDSVKDGFTPSRKF